MKIASVKPFCWKCDRCITAHIGYKCRIPVERDLWCDHVPWTMVQCDTQNANNDCRYFTPKRGFVQKVVEFFWRKT